MKKCTGCGQVKDEALFYKNKYRKDGLSCRCKTCDAFTDLNYRLTHLESIKATQKRYREAHAKEISAKVSAWCKAHPEHIKARRKALKLKRILEQHGVTK